MIAPISARENKRKRNDKQIIAFCQRVEKALEHEGDSDTNCNWCTRNSFKRLRKKAERTKDQRKSGKHPDYSILKIG